MITAREVVEKSYQAVNSGDWETYLSLYDRNVTSDIANIERNQVIEESTDSSLEKRREGFDAIKEAVRGIQEGYSSFQNHPTLMVAEDENVMAISHIEGVTTSGTKIDGRVAEYFQVRNGKITAFANWGNSEVFKPFVEQEIPEDRQLKTKV